MTISESKGRFFYKTNRIESIRIANWNALISTLHNIYKCSVVWLWCAWSLDEGWHLWATIRYRAVTPAPNAQQLSQSNSTQGRIAAQPKT